MSSRHRLALAASTLLALLSLELRARADGLADAWSDAKGGLPANVAVVAGLNLGTLRHSTIYNQLVGMLLAGEPGAQKGIDLVKSACGLDVQEAVQGFVIAMDDQQKGVLFVATKGVEEKTVIDCLGKLSAADKKKMVVKASPRDKQGIVEYSSSDDPRPLYLAYLPHHVIVIGTDPFDKTILSSWLGGTGIDPATPAGKRLAKLDTAAGLWMLVAKHQEIGDGVGMEVAYGKADLVAGTLGVSLHLVLATAAQAEKTATELRGQLGSLKDNPQVPVQLRTTLATLVLSNEKEELGVRFNIAEQDLVVLLGLLQNH